MILTCRPLEDVGGVNVWRYAPAARMSEGDGGYVYLQLTDSSIDRPEQGFSPSGRRFVPAVAATLQVVLRNIDDARKVTRTATQPFVGDSSIWRFQVLASDGVKGTVDLVLLLTEGSVVTHGLLQAGLLVSSQPQG